MITKSSNTKTFGTGGDLLWHQGQIIFSNVLRILLIFAASFVAFWAILVSSFVSPAGVSIWLKSIVAEVMCVFFMGNYKFSIMEDAGKKIEVPAKILVQLVTENASVVAAFDRIHWLAAVSFFLAVAMAGGAVYANFRFGKKAQKDEFLRGQKVITAKALSELVENKSPIHLAEVSIPEPLLPRNILLAGSMGTGKSVGIFQMLEDARKWKKKCIIYDKTGELVQKFFRPGIDILLNPVDARCADWSIMADLRKITDPAMVSRFFVPENKKSADPVWDNAARMLLEDVIKIVAEKRGTMNDVRKIVTQLPLDELHELLSKHGAPSVGIINPKNEKGSESIRLTLTAQPAIRFFSFFDDRTAKFSVRDFVRREDDACLFLVSNSTQHESVRPFISAWIELSLAEAMSMPPTDQIRLFFFLDELASLSKLNSLQIALTEARKYGIVSIVGIQNLSQLDEIYGDDLTKVMVANLQNKYILRCEEEASAKRLADTLGKEEVEEVNESKSFGVESSRDGVNLGTKRAERHLVTPTEIMILPDLVGYLKIAGAYPIAKMTLEWKHRENLNEAYIERDGLDMVFNDGPHEIVFTMPKSVSDLAATSPEAAADVQTAWKESVQEGVEFLADKGVLAEVPANTSHDEW